MLQSPRNQSGSHVITYCGCFIVLFIMQSTTRRNSSDDNYYQSSDTRSIENMKKETYPANKIHRLYVDSTQNGRLCSLQGIYTRSRLYNTMMQSPCTQSENLVASTSMQRKTIHFSNRVRDRARIIENQPIFLIQNTVAMKEIL